MKYFTHISIISTVLLLFSTINVVSSEGVPMEACRECCNSFPLSNSFLIGCKTVGCLIGASGSCPGGLSQAGTGCLVGQSLVSTGEAQLEGKEFSCHYSEEVGAALFQQDLIISLDECASCCNEVELLFPEIDSNQCKNGCTNNCPNYIGDCGTGLDFVLIGESTNIPDTNLYCVNGRVKLDINPTKSPTPLPTNFPTLTPTSSPSTNPSQFPTENPTKRPSLTPTLQPSNFPSENPTKRPSLFPTEKPTKRPSSTPTENPSYFPSENPTQKPTLSPNLKPSENPTTFPSKKPTLNPTQSPIEKPTSLPTINPSSGPTTISEIIFSPETSTTGVTATIVGLLCGLIISASLCVFFLRTSTREVRYITKTPPPPATTNNTQRVEMDD